MKLIEQATRRYLDGWVDPNDRVDKIAEVAAEMCQAPPQMIADERELIIERFAEHRFTVAQAGNPGNGREDEIAGSYSERRAECATERVVALNAVAVHQRMMPDRMLTRRSAERQTWRAIVNGAGTNLRSR